MAQPEREISGFTVLPIQFPKTKAFPQATTHYIYLQPHDPRIPDPSSPRSLFLVNVPVTTTESHLRHLFNTQLGAGRVEEVYFGEARTQKKAVVGGRALSVQESQQQSRSKKRKRESVEDVEVALEAAGELPRTWSNELHASGAHAVVVFVDKTSMEASLKAVKRAAKKSVEIVWAEGLHDASASFGLQRYETYNKLRYPSRKELLHSVDNYMTAFTKLEEARAKAEAKKRQMHDEDGFITVTKGTRGGVVRRDDAKELAQKQKEKKNGLEDFYRFQMRERRKDEQGQLIKQFEEDRKKVEDMRKRRGRLRPE